MYDVWCESGWEFFFISPPMMVYMGKCEGKIDRIYEEESKCDINNLLKEFVCSGLNHGFILAAELN